jgi:hypothetical protein
MRLVAIRSTFGNNLSNAIREYKSLAQKKRTRKGSKGAFSKKIKEKKL